MLDRDFCGICQRDCQDSDRVKCLSNPKLNLGSGQMLLKEYINFDVVEVKRGDMKTDVFGLIENVTDIFGSGVFKGILSSHVVEHFNKEGGKKMIQDCYALLEPGGKLILEGPDFIGCIELYQAGHPAVTWNMVVCSLWGTTSHYGEYGRHRWGYTKETAAKLVEECGFEVVHKGIGRTHGMGKRDFRVEGVKK